MNSNDTLLLYQNLTNKKLSQELSNVINTMNQYSNEQRNKITRYYDSNLVDKFMNVSNLSLLDKAKLMSKIIYLSGISSKYITYYKNHFNIPRPFVLLKDLPYVPVVTAKSPSYPSGHSMGYTLLYRIFSNVDPKNNFVYKQIADKGKISRVIAGVHTFADITGGEILGNAIYNKHGF